MGGGVSIRTRLTLIIMGLTLGCLAVGFTVVGFRQVKSFREQRLQAMTVIAKMTADSTVSGLTYFDPQDAGDTLAGLDAFVDIEAAALYDEHGKLFATYERGQPPRCNDEDEDAENDCPTGDDGEAAAAIVDRPGGRTWPETLAADAPMIHEVRDDVTVVRIPIIDRKNNDLRLGVFEVVASNGTMHSEIRSFQITLVAVALGLVALSVLAAWILQRRITRPIFDLADVARRITIGEDPSLRAPTGAAGEIGVLSQGFNAMLGKLETRELELLSSRDTVRAVIDASPVAIIGIDGNGFVTLWNARAEAIFGVTQEDAIGKAITVVAPSPTLAGVWGRSAAESLSGSEVEVTPDRILAVSTAALPLGGSVIMVADITERRRAAEALAERATQLQRAQKTEVVGRLAGGVAHDFNNLITVIMASCQMLQWRSSARPELKLYIENILNAGQRGAALSRRLLAFSRQQAVDPRPVDARTVISDLEKMVRSVVGENISVELDLPDISSVVMVDQGQLEQVLLNMVLNARDAMSAGGGVLTLGTKVIEGAEIPEVATRSPTGSWVALAVNDTGSGMSSETMARIFEPFFTTKVHGTGLGLATAHQITRDLGGEITVSSKLGKGTTFTLWLPRFAGYEASVPDSAVTAPVVGNDTVLLVEDEVALRNLIQIMLAEAGYHVLAAATPHEALALGSAPGVHIDLLLTDVVMPNMSGPQLAAELVRRRPEIEVLYMSGYIGDALSEYGLDEAAATLIHKPFKPDQLLKLVRDLLDARPARRARRPSEHVFGRPPDGAASN